MLCSLDETANNRSRLYFEYPSVLALRDHQHVALVRHLCHAYARNAIHIYDKTQLLIIENISVTRYRRHIQALIYRVERNIKAVACRGARFAE